jgi:hypothetical protein
MQRVGLSTVDRRLQQCAQSPDGALKEFAMAVADTMKAAS